MVATVVLRAVQFAGALVLFGTPAQLLLFRSLEDTGAAAAHGGFHDGPARARLLRLAGWTLAVTAVTLVVWMLVQAAMMGAGGLNASLVETVAARTRFGRIALFRMAAMLVLAGLLMTGLRSRALEVLALLAAAMALLPLVGIGHAAAAAQIDYSQLGAQAVHLLALGAWIGGLPAFWIATAPAAGRHQSRAASIAAATGIYSNISIACVALVVSSGTWNAKFLLGSATNLFDTVYGELLLGKLVLLAVLLAVAADTLFRQRPVLMQAAGAAPAQALARMRVNLLIEIALAGGILLIVGAFGIAAPPMA